MLWSNTYIYVYIYIEGKQKVENLDYCKIIYELYISNSQTKIKGN